MKILLVGEYNSSHKTLKKGLVTLGHEVTVVSMGDGFKKRSGDVNFRLPFGSGFPNFMKRVIYKVFKVDLVSQSVRRQFYKKKEVFQNNDIVQLISENPFYCVPKIEEELLDFIFRHNTNVFLLSCGTDHISVSYSYARKARYSILTPYFQNKGNKKDYAAITKYLSPGYTKLHNFIYKNLSGIIASDLDYHIPLQGNKKYLGMVPNPIDLKEIDYISLPNTDTIVIFHGINTENYYKKGNYLFEEALALVEKQYQDRVKIITVRSVPYDEYIKAYDQAHILLDQVFAYDQGFNALEGMAKGKVVFTGAEQEWLDYYGLEADTVAINALPEAEKIAEKLAMLIEQPEKIQRISKKARQFIEEHHDHLSVAKQYFEKWTSVI